ncbi:MAG: hypothetical protein FWF94_04895 [Oscillospiraceae bacterium]|nr:hypothetical protein [Oscillospiraceae bacterium]
MDLNYDDINNIDFIKKQIESVTRVSRVHVNRIIALISMLEAADDGEKNGDIISDLRLCCYKLLSQNMNMMYLYSEEMTGSGSVIDAAEFMKGIVGECTKMLESFNVKLQLKGPSKNLPDML